MQNILLYKRERALEVKICILQYLINKPLFNDSPNEIKKKTKATHISKGSLLINQAEVFVDLKIKKNEINVTEKEI